MLKTGRTVNTASVAWSIGSTGAEPGSTGFVECAIFSFAGLAVALLLIANGVLATAMQTILQ